MGSSVIDGLMRNLDLGGEEQGCPPPITISCMNFEGGEVLMRGLRSMHPRRSVFAAKRPAWESLSPPLIVQVFTARPSLQCPP